MAFSDRPSPGGLPNAAPEHPAHPGKHLKRHHSAWVLVVPAVAVLVALVALSVFLTRQSTQPSASPAAAHGGGDPAGSGGSQAGQGGADQVVAVRRAELACRQVWQAQAATLRAADRSLAQWQTHVQAMNALVAGRISFAQASQFWARTRVGAMQRVRDFERSYRALRRDRSPCSVHGTGSATPAAPLEACANAVRLRDRTLAVAHRAIRTWRGHIREMEMLRNGQLSPATATQMWIAMWHRGQHQLDNYHSVASRPAAQQC